MKTTTLEQEVAASRTREAQLNLAAWHDVSRWLDYAAAEFVKDAVGAGYLEHVGQCVREEGERRYATSAGLAVAAA